MVTEMRIVVTLGGNALLRRGEALTAENQMKNIRLACAALKNLAARHELVLGHGNGPQVGLLALQNEAFAEHAAPYPLDVLGAESQAMIGCMFAQAMHNALPDRKIVNIVTHSEVDKNDPAFVNPTKFIGPVYDKETARALAEKKGWIVRADGPYYRRVVPSPKPVRILEIDAIKKLVDSGIMVIAGGGGGVPVSVSSDKSLDGIEAVIDKDYCCSILAVELNADLFVIATDVAGVYLDWGTPEERLIREASPEDLKTMGFASGSMGPKVSAAIEFVERTGRTAVIGSLEKIELAVEGKAGTRISADCAALVTEA